MILRFCYEQQFLTFEHVSHFFLTHRAEPYRRVKELEKAGFVEKHQNPVTGKYCLIRLTNLGQTYVQENSPTSSVTAIKPVKNLSPTTLLHDSLVTSCRLKLSRLWNANFIPERALKTSDFQEVPDGLFVFKSGNGIAIEVENSDKGRTRFLKLVSRWKDKSGILFVLYIASNPKLFQSLSSYLNSAPQDQPIGLVLWDELKSGVPLITTARGKMDLLNQREF